MPRCLWYTVFVLYSHYYRSFVKIWSRRPARQDHSIVRLHPSKSSHLRTDLLKITTAAILLRFVRQKKAISARLPCVMSGEILLQIIHRDPPRNGTISSVIPVASVADPLIEVTAMQVIRTVTLLTQIAVDYVTIMIVDLAKKDGQASSRLLFYNQPVI